MSDTSKKLSLVMAIVASCSLVACGTGELDEEGVEQEEMGKEDSASSSKPKTIKVTETKNGKTVSARVGDTVEVRLAGNPTTGYHWQATAYSKSCPVTDPDGTYIPASGAMVGSGGTYLFVIKPDMFAKGGTFKLQFAYFRPWENAAKAAKTFSFSLKVSNVVPQSSPLPPTWCSDGTIVTGAPKFIASADGKQCEMPSVVCLTKDASSCPQLSPLPPSWCSDGIIVKGAPKFIASADGKQCQMPSVVCLTKDASSCPQLSPLPPSWCSDGIIVKGAPKFIASADGKQCQMPSVVCLTKDASACPQL